MNLTEPGCTQVKLTNLGQPGYSSRSSQQELGLAQAARLRKPREPAAPGSQGCFKELTRHQVQPGCSGKAFVLWPDRAGRAPSHPQSQEWWTDWRNRSNKYLGSRSLPGPFPPPCLQPFTPSPFRSDHWVKRPDAPLSVRQRSPRRSRLSRRVGVPGLGTKPGDVGAIPGLRPPRGTRQ